MTREHPPGELQMVPIDRIRVLNPRDRNGEVFEEIVGNIKALGLKKPVTVTQRMDAIGPYFLLICGEGRLKAFRALGQTEIPAMVVHVGDEDAFIMSLAENIARRQGRPLELLAGIDQLKKLGYDRREIAKKTGLSQDYVHGILQLLENGEERLLVAVERGHIPLNAALTIAGAGSNDKDIQAALQEAYESGNTLSAALRDCWDGVDLKPATKTFRVHASEPHVCLSGAITPSELLALVQRRDLLNGFVNRFLMVWGERTQVEAFPRRAPQARVEALAAEVVDILTFTRSMGEFDGKTVQMTMTDKARQRYASLYQRELNEDLGSPLIDSLLERRAPMLLRLAMVFALTDRTWHIAEEHISAAMAWVRYATDSVGFVLAGGNSSPSRSQVEWAAGRISAFLAAKGFASRRDLVVDCFGRHQPATIVDAAITHLMESAPGTVQVEVQSRSRAGPGRPATIYRLVRPHMAN